MGRRRPTDWVNWTLYRRAWLLCAIAFVLVLATSFRPQTPPQAPLPPTFTNEEAGQLVDRARMFDRKYADRRPGSPGSLDAAQWLRGEFAELGLKATTVPNTTTSPLSSTPVSIVNVEAEVPGRTRETVVIYAHRDNAGKGTAPGAPVATMALLHLAEELRATADLRRTYLLVSTDGATLNSAGARALSSRLLTRSGRIVAVIGLDRIASRDGQLAVPFTPSGRWAPQLGLTVAATDAVRAEVGRGHLPSIPAQLVRLAAPLTLYEQGQLVADGHPAVSFTAGGERAHWDDRADRADERAVGDAMRSLQRLTGTLDALDTLQSAGKTYVATEQRVYRGWALKIFIASLLVPFWLAASDLVVRMRRHVSIVVALGSVARAMLAAIWALALLWLFDGIGLLSGSRDGPPQPDTLRDAPVGALVLWLVLAGAGWLLARGPDWRHARTPLREQAVLAMCLVALGVLAAAALAANPYTVLFIAPALHVWLWLCSRHVHGRVTFAVWGAGLVLTLVPWLALAGRFDVELGALGYWLALVHTRTIPAMQSLLAACAISASFLALVASRGHVAMPLLPRARRVLTQLSAAGGAALPADRMRALSRLARTHAREARGLPAAADPTARAARRAAARSERAARPRAGRKPQKTR